VTCRCRHRREERDLASSGLRPAKEIEQGGQLALAADQRRQPVLGRHVEAGSPAPGPEDLIGSGRGVPLDLDLAQLQGLEKATDRLPRRLVHEHAARAGQMLQPRGDVGGVADRGVVHPQVVADAADHHGPGVQADPHPERDAALSLKLAAVVAQRPLDAEGGVHGAARGVLVGDRGPE
jgi:hypothetical protein